MYIRDPQEIEWIKERLHQNSNIPNFTSKQKEHILHKLNQASQIKRKYELVEKTIAPVLTSNNKIIVF